jgi:hypothetical protein
MDWIKKQYKGYFWYLLIINAILAAMPWISSPYLLTVFVGTAFGYIWLTLYVIVRVIWASIFKKKNDNNT